MRCGWRHRRWWSTRDRRRSGWRRASGCGRRRRSARRWRSATGRRRSASRRRRITSGVEGRSDRSTRFLLAGVHVQESVPVGEHTAVRYRARQDSTLSFGIPTPAKIPASCGAPPAPGLALAPSSSSSWWPALGRVGGFGAEAAGADPSLTTPAPWTTVLSTVWTCLRPFPFWICCSRAESIVRG